MNYKELSTALENATPASFAPEPTAAAKSHTNAALIGAIMRGIAPALHQHVRDEIQKATAPLLARIDELERRGYCGVWKSGREYSPQSECTHDGVRWLAHKRTADRPGSSGDWVMMEKSDEPAVSHGRNGSAGGPAQPRRA